MDVSVARNQVNLAYFLLGAVLFTSFWQLEIVWWRQWWEWSYNFGGLGDFGWMLYTWRDFWYGVIFVVFLFTIAINRLGEKACSYEELKETE